MRLEKEIISITNKTEMKQKKSTREFKKKKSVIFKVETVLFVFFYETFCKYLSEGWKVIVS